jgi:hypothetical protein
MDALECRFCLQEGKTNDKRNPLWKPCKCKGTSAYVHKICLTKWRMTTLRVDQDIQCPVCNSVYDIQILGLDFIEIIPEYSGFSYILLHPTIIMILNTYSFALYTANKSLIVIKNHTVSFLDRETDESIDFTNSYLAMHLLTAGIYLIMYIYHLKNVRNLRRYFSGAKVFIAIPLLHIAILSSFRLSPLLNGLAHYYLLPIYLKRHINLLHLANSQF